MMPLAWHWLMKRRMDRVSRAMYFSEYLKRQKAGDGGQGEVLARAGQRMGQRRERKLHIDLSYTGRQRV